MSVCPTCGCTRDMMKEEISECGTLRAELARVKQECAELRGELEYARSDNDHLEKAWLSSREKNEQAKESGALSMIHCINANRIDKEDPAESLPHLGEDFWMAEWRKREAKHE